MLSASRAYSEKVFGEMITYVLAIKYTYIITCTDCKTNLMDYSYINIEQY